MVAPDRDAGDGHAFDEDERIAFHDHAVGERAAVALVGIADDVFLVGLGVGDRLPFDAGRKARAAAAAQPGLGYLLDDAGRIREGLPEPLVAIVGLVIVKRTGIHDSAACECQARLLLQERLVFGQSDAQL